MFYGDRSAAVTDPFGNFWAIATHIQWSYALSFDPRSTAIFDQKLMTSPPVVRCSQPAGRC